MTVHNPTLVVKPTILGEYLRGCIVLLALSATVQAAFESVLKQVGATMPHRDSLDARIVEEARTGTARFGGTYGDGKGIIDSPNTVGGWPELKSLAAPADSDGDGMPDEWESRFGFDPKDASDHTKDKAGDGYTNVEEILNGTTPRDKLDYLNLDNTIDTIS